MLKHKVTTIEQYYPLLNYAHPKNLCNPTYLLNATITITFCYAKNGKMNIISKLQLQMKGNPIHIPEWLIHLFNLIILGKPPAQFKYWSRNSNAKIESATLRNWSAWMRFSNHNNKNKLQRFMEQQLKISRWTELLQLPHELHKR